MAGVDHQDFCAYKVSLPVSLTGCDVKASRFTEAGTAGPPVMRNMRHMGGD